MNLSIVILYTSIYTDISIEFPIIYRIFSLKYPPPQGHSNVINKLFNEGERIRCVTSFVCLFKVIFHSQNSYFYQYYINYSEVYFNICFYFSLLSSSAVLWFHLVEAHRALELLEDYHSRLSAPQDRTLRIAIERVIRIFKSRLFQALLGKYYQETD